MRSVLLCSLLFLWTWIAGCATQAVAPRNDVADLVIDGDVQERVLTIADLEALGAADVAWTHKENTTVYRAVPLEAVLRSAGVTPGEMSGAPAEKRAGWKYAVLATATDGFQATFSVAEVFKAMGRTEAFVALSESAKPATRAEGRFRLIVTSDGEGSRSVRDLRRLTILDLRRVRERP
jgi:hypothetical protein